MFNTGIARRSGRSRLANQNQTLWTPLAILAAGSLRAVAAMMAAPIVFLDSEMIERHSGNSRSNQLFGPGTFQAPLHQYVKESCESITSRSHFGRKQIREYDLR